MSKSLSASVRRQIIEFNPQAPGGPSIQEFCASLGIVRSSYYNIKKRYFTEGNGALNPHSRAPKSPARKYGDEVKTRVLATRKRLARAGWDNGPLSIWFEFIDTQELGPTPPSVATIGRVLAEAGVTQRNPRKRPRSAWIRWARSHPMELWQLDAFEYRLFDLDTTKVIIYQLLDDGTRFDVGTHAGWPGENSTDAQHGLKRAFDAYGVPQELLSDNGAAFNLLRHGVVGATETFLAERGCVGITGQFAHPQTQGKNERAHQTLIKFLDAHSPQTLDRVTALIADFRDHYNHRRRHQALRLGTVHLTPAQAWEAGAHRPSDGTPIDPAELIARATKYRDRALATQARVDPPSAQAITPLPPGVPLPQPLALRQEREDVITITRSNPQIYYRGRIFKVPTHLVGVHQLVLNADSYTLFSTIDGEESAYFPLPVRVSSSKRLVPIWQVFGARIRDPRPAWEAKRIQHHHEYYTP